MLISQPFMIMSVGWKMGLKIRREKVFKAAIHKKNNKNNKLLRVSDIIKTAH